MLVNGPIGQKDRGQTQRRAPDQAVVNQLDRAGRDRRAVGDCRFRVREKGGAGSAEVTPGVRAVNDNLTIRPAGY